MTILDEIVQHKKSEIRQREEACSLDDLMRQIGSASPPRGFRRTVTEQATVAPSIIAEVKRGSPSLGCVKPNMDVVDQAKQYEDGGASALSVLTDTHYFYANESDFTAIRSATSLPMLRKEFIVDTYQVYESRAIGADCILLIMSILTSDMATRLASVAQELGMDVLVETHTVDELRQVLEGIPHDLIGVNNRNLRTFETSYRHTLELADAVPNRAILVAESGLKDKDAIAELWGEGITIFLVGEAFVVSANPRLTVNSFVNIDGPDLILNRD